MKESIINKLEQLVGRHEEIGNLLSDPDVIGNQRYPSDIHYTLVGYVPGNYKALPSMLRNYYEPGQFTVAESKSLQVLPSSSSRVDEYKLTPDELYYLGGKEFEKQAYDAAHQYLSELYTNWSLDADKQKNVVQ